MVFDFSREEEQREFTATGPIPAGSIVAVEMEVLMPNGEYQAAEDCYISKTRNEMRQIYCQFTVTRGQYEGISWRESITLPFGMQPSSLTAGQLKSTQIGGAILKAILQAAKKPMQIQNVREFTGLRFPVKVKINPNPREKDGTVYWNNLIAKVITPDMPEYEEVKRQGEIINENGAVTASQSEKKSYSKSQTNDTFGNPNPSEPSIDDYVF